MEYEDIGPQPNKRPIYTFPRCNTPCPDESFYSTLEEWVFRDVGEESDVDKEVVVE